VAFAEVTRSRQYACLGAQRTRIMLFGVCQNRLTHLVSSALTANAESATSHVCHNQMFLAWPRSLVAE
jgi:hypothetical protein